MRLVRIVTYLHCAFSVGNREREIAHIILSFFKISNCIAIVREIHIILVESGSY